MIVQKLFRKENDVLLYAYKYYALVALVNNLSLSKREIQLLSFFSVKGNIYYTNIKQEFIERYNTSSASINNMMSKMIRLGVFVKENKKIRVAAPIALNFSTHKEIVIQIKLSNE
jgi:hypothetical protein